MSCQDEASVQEVAKDGPPPLYTEHQESQAQPDYGKKQALNNLAATSSRYRPFPSVMNTYGQWMQWKTLNLCGASPTEHLCLVEMHIGYSGKGPLGTRPGVLLHNGMSIKDPILAAAGDESQGVHALNINSVILLPPLEPDTNSGRMDTEIMRGAISADHRVAFRFSIEVGEKERREEFEWRKFKKGDGDNAKRSGFKLLRLFPSSQKIRPSSSSSQESSCSLPAGNDTETVAVLTWTTTWTSLTHAFSLELMGSGQSGVLGERWTLMVVITALRLYTLHAKGRTSKTLVGMGEKVSGK